MNGKSENTSAAGQSSPPASPAGERPAAGLNDRWPVIGVCLFLAAIVWVVFGQTLGHEFVNYDDDLYVYENPAVTSGLNLKGFEWAFTHVVCGNWHPVTMLSHMLDCQLYGLNAGGHHLTNILIHTATAILLFLVLRRMTGCLWRSAFVAAVFAIHPLRVESVAWVAERKDVLSGLFFLLTIWAYVRYAQEVSGDRCPVRRTDPASSRFTIHDSRFYWLVLLFFTLGLMSKPMLVTLPLVLLLLDYWPLRRVAGGGWRVAGSDSYVTPHVSRFPFPVFRLPPQVGHLLLEKLPLLVLSGAACVVTIFVQHEAILSVDKFPLSLRFGNALISYVVYLGQTFWPGDLAVLYPLGAGGVAASKVVLSLVLLAGVTAGALIQRRRRPYLLAGWLWYLIMLVPVIGIVQVGGQAHADRYTYLPQVGLYLMLTWLAAELCAGWRQRRLVLGGGAAIILVAMIICARAQTAYWRNSESLWTRTLACTSDNYVAHNNLGNILFQKGQMDEAITHYLQALEIKPDFAGAHNNLGNVLVQKGRVEEGIAQFQKALEIKPDYVEADINLGMALLKNGRVDESIAYCQIALEIQPANAEACYNLGNALLQKGDWDEAIARYQTALQISPDNAKAHNNLGNALLQKGRVDEATAHFQKALQINPAYAGACYNLGNALLQKGDVDEAIAQYQRALQIKPGYAEARNILRAALLQKGREDEIMAQYRKALQINPDHPGVMNNLAWLLATGPDAHVRDGVQAVKYAEHACELTHYGVPPFVGTLAAAYAEAGRFDDAVATVRKASALAAVAGETNLLGLNQKLLDLYRAHQPYHEVVGKLVPSAP